MAAPSLEKRLSAAADDSINQLGGSFRGSSMRVEKPKSAPGWCSGICGGSPPKEREVDVILIGAGVMSATVGLMLKELEPNWKMMMFERLGAPGEESSNGFNNAGTGHAGFMEPNYTKEVKNADGSLKTVTTDKALHDAVRTKPQHVCEQFLSSRQYWDYLTKTGKLPKPDTWIHQTNHIALGVGKDQVEFIKKRYEAMKSHPLFSSMEICLPEEKEKAKQWAPLIMKGRDPNEPICMTKVSHGTDVDYGALTKAKITAFQELGGDLRLHTEVTDLKKNKDGKWVVTTKVNGAGSGWAYNKAKFVFVGAGGWALLMLQKAGIPEVNGYMALPVTGDWAICQNPEVVSQHKVKVYAPGAPGAPPMSMPHLDYRTIGGKEVLLFGPFGSMTMKFLRYGSITDAFKALKPHNLLPTAGALSRNLSLAVMLMKDVFKSAMGKLHDIRHYYPEADPDDWVFIPAGVRAQIIKKDPKTGKGMLQFGTEVVTGANGTICGLLGASPGASTCVSIALDVIEKCFGSSPEFKTKWSPKLKEMIPSWSPDVAAGDMKKVTPDVVNNIYKTTGATLKITPK
eukprot:s2854_g6.t1